MSRFNLTNPNNPVVEWINKYHTIIVQIVENHFRETGFNVFTICVDDHLHTCVYGNMGFCGSINITRLLISIVAPNGKYDRKLANRSYASIKAHKNINTRVIVAKAAFGENAIDNIMTVTKNSDVHVQVFQPMC